MMFIKGFNFLYSAAVLGGLVLFKAVEGFPHGLIDRENDHVFQGSHWVDIWTAMPQLTEPANLPGPPFNGSTTVFFNSTIRQTAHSSIGADLIRIRISNAFGIDDLVITNITISLPSGGKAGSSTIEPQSLKTVTFSGQPGIVVPDAGLAVSDPLPFHVEPQSMLAVTIYLEQGQQGGSITSHPGSRTTSWITFGNQVDAANITGPSTQSIEHWYFISAIEGWVSRESSGFAIIGDSITDGRGSDTDMNNRWPDLVLAKMQRNPNTSSIAVLNQAAGGNRILHDGLGPNVISRVDRDVLAQSGIKYAMIFEGINDIGVANPDSTNQTLVGDRLISAYEQIVARVHTFGIPIFAATITPFGTPENSSVIQPYSSPVREQTRQRINAWIRTSGMFDAVIDFDAIVRNPESISELAPQYDSGDHLHPNVAGYQAIADSFPISLFAQFADGVNRLI